MTETRIPNLKADKFQSYLKENKVDFFKRDDKHDESNTVLFRSNIAVERQKIPVNIITDSSIYTLIRVFIGSGLIKDVNRSKFENFLNVQNRSYKVFKYAATEDGDIFLDACIPSMQDSFDPRVVRIVLDVIVDHLTHEYKNVMKLAWE